MSNYPSGARGFLSLLALWLTVSFGTSHAAIDPSDLLPVEEAFALQASALDGESVELRWQIADGYYLYRHRIGVERADGAALGGELALPPGEASEDEFFGAVETYRGELVARLDGVDAPAGALQLQVRYQGCADIGICYPPHQQLITVDLPASIAPGNNASGLPGAAPGGLPGGLPGFPAPRMEVDSRPLLGSKPPPLTGFDGPVLDALPLPEDEAFEFEAIAVAADELLLRFTPAAGYYLYRDRSSFTVDAEGVEVAAPEWPEGSTHEDEHFGEVIVYFDQVEVPLRLARSAGDARTINLSATFQGCQTDGICYPPMTREVAIDLPAGAVRELPPAALAEAPAEALAASSAPLGWGLLLLALLSAVVGGLILNLMPCVLPVLSLKALGLAQSGHDRAGAKRHALWYTAGVLASFAAIGLLVIALRAAGEILGWGFQLQQPLFVAALVYLMFAIGLSLSGVFSVGDSLAGAGQGLTERSGPAGDFFTGVLAVVVASPCTAPLMGTALAFAFAAPAWVALLVFLALGFGLALPFLLIGFIPALARRLPKPGAWMQTFKQVMAFPMYLTGVWLLWVLINQRGADAAGLVLVGLVLLAATLWWWERARWRGALPGKLAAALLLVLALLPLAFLPQRPAAAGSAEALVENGVPYSAERLAALQRDGRSVFVNMTADWCATCKVNERRVIDTDRFRGALAAADAVYMVGDWTNVDAEITRFLESQGAVGVPLYVVFRDGVEPRVLPTLLSHGAVETALPPVAATAAVEP